MIINLQPNDYYTQRNNTIRPLQACMPTARVMFYLANNFTIKSPPADISLDDWMMTILNTSQAVDFKNAKYPWAESYPPNEIHGMYPSYLDKLVIGKRVSDFKTNLSFEEYCTYIEEGKAIMTSGTFPAANIFGHAFTVVGLDGKYLLLADPYGDYRSHYRSRQGYLVRMDKPAFIKHVKPAGQSLKWGHVPI